MFLHKRIKRFELTGQIADDKFIPRMKDEYVRLLADSMRDEGYVQRLDIEPDWSLSYTGNYYEFILSVYGAFVGKSVANKVEALDKNRALYGAKHNEKM